MRFLRHKLCNNFYNVMCYVQREFDILINVLDRLCKNVKNKLEGVRVDESSGASLSNNKNYSLREKLLKYEVMLMNCSDLTCT
jgi:hypothetical protein